MPFHFLSLLLVLLLSAAELSAQTTAVIEGAVQDTSGQLLLVKLMELSRAEGLLLEPAALLIGAVYPDNTVRLAEGDHLLDPLSGLRVSDHRYGPFYFSVAKSQSGQVARASPGGRCVPLR
jgi:hypothetical protein